MEQQYTVTILESNFYSIVSMYMIEIQCFKDMCEEELEDYGETEWYYKYLECLTFYKEQLEKVKPLFKQHDRIHYEMFEKIDWAYDEEILY